MEKLGIGSEVGDILINMYWNIDTESSESNIEFNYETNKYPDMIELNGDFTIEINNKAIFKEPDFPIIEFIRALENWDRKNVSFIRPSKQKITRLLNLLL